MNSCTPAQRRTGGGWPSRPVLSMTGTVGSRWVHPRGTTCVGCSSRPTTTTGTWVTAPSLTDTSVKWKRWVINTYRKVALTSFLGGGWLLQALPIHHAQRKVCVWGGGGAAPSITDTSVKLNEKGRWLMHIEKSHLQACGTLEKLYQALPIYIFEINSMLLKLYTFLAEK